MAFHAHFTKGKRVIVILKSGKSVIGKFITTDFKKKVVIISTADDHQDKPTKIQLKRIRSIGYYRPPTSKLAEARQD